MSKEGTLALKTEKTLFWLDVKYKDSRAKVLRPWLYYPCFNRKYIPDNIQGSYLRVMERANTLDATEKHLSKRGSRQISVEICQLHCVALTKKMHRTEVMQKRGVDKFLSKFVDSVGGGEGS